MNSLHSESVPKSKARPSNPRPCSPFLPCKNRSVDDYSSSKVVQLILAEQAKRKTSKTELPIEIVVDEIASPSLPLSPPSVREELLTPLTPLVRAPRAPQPHLHARRSNRSSTVLLQMPRSQIRQSSNERGGVVQRGSSSDVHSKLRNPNEARKRSQLRCARDREVVASVNRDEEAFDSPPSPQARTRYPTRKASRYDRS